MLPRTTLRAIVETVIPEASALAEGDWSDVFSIIDQAIAERPAKMQRQLGAYLRALDFLSVGRFGKSFSKLPQDKRTRIFESLQDAPVLLLRRGTWGVRTLALMGYYARNGAASELGYAAQLRGWSALT